MKIGILGTRGIPNAYGGFEQFAQYLALGLKDKGHDIWVYNSSNHPYQQDEWKGVHIVHCRDMESSIGTAGQFIYDLNCLRDARARDYDILLQLGYTSNSVWRRWWPSYCPNVVNMDGLEWKRSKYNLLTRKFLKQAERWAAKKGDLLIADSIGIREHLLRTYDKPSTYIPYGADIFHNIDAPALKNWDLKAHQYFLLIARMEPENNIEMILRGYLHSSQKYPIILVGSTENKFGKMLSKKYSSTSVRFVGGIYDQHSLNNLRYFSKLYFHGHSVGGTNPSLLEAMACQCTIVAHDNVFNKAILMNSSHYFKDEKDVAEIIDATPDEHVINEARMANLEKIKSIYSWPIIIDSYERVFLDLTQKVKL